MNAQVNSQEFAYTTESNKSVDDTTVALLKATEQKGGWTIFQVYDIQERLAAKGFTHTPLKIIEICSAKYASQFLKDDLLTSLCMPCKINAYQDGERVLIALMKPSIVTQFFPNTNSEKALQAEKELIEIIENSLK